MGVFPAASGNFLPETWRSLMMSPVSVFTSFPRLFTSRSFFFFSLSLHLILNSFSLLRILPSSTSTPTTSPSISTARNTPGRVSHVIQWPGVTLFSSWFVRFHFEYSYVSVCMCVFFLKAWPCYLLWMNVGWGRRWLTSIPTSHLRKVSKKKKTSAV